MILTNEFTVGFGIETRLGSLMIDLANMARLPPRGDDRGVRATERLQGRDSGAYRADDRRLTRVKPRWSTSTSRPGRRPSCSRPARRKARDPLLPRSAVASKRLLKGGTRVVTKTDLQITGPQAQFGKGVLEDVGSRVLDEFSKRLETKISAEARGRPRRRSRLAMGWVDHPRTGGHHGARDEVLGLGRVRGADDGP